MSTRSLRRRGELVEIDACPRCDGLWLDAGEMEKVQRAAPPRARLRPGRPEDLWDSEKQARERVDAADAESAASESGSDWWFSFLTDLPVEGSNRLFRFPLMTWALMLACCLAFLAQLTSGDRLLEQFGVVPKLFFEGGGLFVRSLVSMFLHVGVAHLIGNLYFLKVFGDNVEDRLGRLSFVALYLIGGLVADLAFVYTNPTEVLPVVGASGAISALLGAYLVLFPHARISVVPSFWNLFQQLQVPALVYLAFWFAWQFVDSAVFEEQRVAWEAHVGGFAAGLVLGWIGRRLLPDARVRAAAVRIEAGRRSL